MNIKNDLISAAKKLAPYIHRTPVLSSEQLNKLAACELYFKCENFQKMGAFKMRGASYALLNLSKEQQAKGVVTHSSGNFAQALALAAKNLQIKAHIVMPSDAPEVKKAAVKGYGGLITECAPNVASRQATAQQIQEETGATFVHPFNDFNVILGNATAAQELVEDYSDLDVIIAPVGGGGLISGTLLSTLAFAPNVKVIGAEPFEVDDAYRSLEAGHIVHNNSTNTIADGLKTNLGDITFAVIQNYIEEIIRVTEDEIIEAMRLIWERMKIIVEPSCATTLAAVLKNKAQFKGKKVGLILTGGNVDLKKLPF